MTDTEKLAELLGKMVDFSDGTLYLMADYLVGKGVVVREKGEWVERKEIFSESEGEVDAVGCPKCGKSQRKYNRTPFCPNCGADMRKGENDG